MRNTKGILVWLGEPIASILPLYRYEYLIYQNTPTKYNELKRTVYIMKMVLNEIKNAVLRTYKSNLFPPFGQATVIITGWEERGTLHCERYVLLEKDKIIVNTSGLHTSIDQELFEIINDNESTNTILDKFINKEGVERAKNDIIKMIFSHIGEEKISGEFSLDLHYSPDANLSFFYDLKLHNNKVYNWIVKSTKSRMLKNYTEKLKKVMITRVSIPPIIYE